MSLLSEAVAAELVRVAQRKGKKVERAAAQAALGPVEEPVEGVDGDEVSPATQDAAAVGGEPIVLSAEEIESVLATNGVPTSASPATPVPLRVTRIHFSGVKVLSAGHPLAAGHALVGPGPRAKGPGDANARDEFYLGLLASDADDVDDEESAERAAGEVTGSVPMAAVPFEWSWEPQLGVNGVGSGKNLRGKSTVLNVLMWALSGRCANFQVDIKAWLKHVEVDWQVGGETGG